MANLVSTLLRNSLILLLAMGISLTSISAVAAQTFGAGAGENPDSENRREPFKIKMSGFLNSQPDEQSLGLVTFGIRSYGETYKFDISALEAPEYPQLSPRAILRQVGKTDVDFNLIGPKDLLSKIGQAEPGTPFAIVGYFTPRDRSLRLESISVIGMEK
ncbi:MAG: hypothetical protein HY268_12145 [Deltaproteobacteria bacterium]|nr:hypothetical protein [Deltaproteobacteria bacterium]